MTEQKLRRRKLSLVGVGVLGFCSLLVASSAAHAAPQEYGNIDSNRTGSLTVHKYLHQTGSEIGDISQAPSAGQFTDPVADVVFTVYPLLQNDAPIDLTVPGSWDLLGDLVPGAGCVAPAGFELGAGLAMPGTDAQGVSSTSIAVGAYQICETSAPANIVDRAVPFILTVPMPHEGGWVYDVHAYPKNGEGSIIKTIDPQVETGLGSLVRFPVTVPVPSMAQGWTGFAISDTLDDRLVPVAPASIRVNADGAALNPSFYTVSVDAQTITMNFTAAGLAWLNEGPDAHVGAEIEVVFAGTVIAIGDGAITNQAVLWPNNPAFDGDGVTITSNEVSTHWGNLQIEKRAAGVSGAAGTLQGAVFEVYNADTPYAPDCTAAQAAGDPIAVSGETTFTSSGTGVIEVAGLFVSDSENPVINAQQRCYVLKEVAAPAGFVLPSQPFTAVTVHIGQTTIADNASIENTQQLVPGLPLTGASGQLILISAGVGALAIAIGLLLLKHRRATAAKKN